MLYLLSKIDCEYSGSFTYKAFAYYTLQAEFNLKRETRKKGGGSVKVLIIYYSRGGTTKKMAGIIYDELQKKGLETKCLFVEEVSAEQLLEYDGIIIGSPTYYGTCAYQVKQLLDDSVSFHGQLDGKAGGVFSSSANVAGGNETTVISILEAMLIHGMVIQGDPQGDHYGPVAVGGVDKRCETNCRRFAQRFGELLEKIK